MRLPDIVGDLKKWFTHYPLYKILALVIAIVVYLYVNGEFK